MQSALESETESFEFSLEDWNKRAKMVKPKPILPIPHIETEKIELPIEKMEPVFRPIEIPGDETNRATPSKIAAGRKSL